MAKSIRTLNKRVANFEVKTTGVALRSNAEVRYVIQSLRWALALAHRHVVIYRLSAYVELCHVVSAASESTGSHFGFQAELNQSIAKSRDRFLHRLNVHETKPTPEVVGGIAL